MMDFLSNTINYIFKDVLDSCIEAREVVFETSVIKNWPTSLNIPEELRSQQHSGESLRCLDQLTEHKNLLTCPCS